MNVGILSFAHLHATTYARCIAAMPDVELVAIADDDVERGAAAVAECGGDFYADYHDLLARDDIAAVIVTAPNAMHHALTLAAAAAGKHVLCEKPIATARADALEMIAACQAHGVILMTAFPMRFSAPAIALRQMVRDGAVGTPLAVMATNHGTLPAPPWFADPHLGGGGAVMDHTVHVADLLRWTFAQEITRVYAEIDTRTHPGLPTDDVGLLMLELESGIWGSLDPSWARPKTWPTWGGLTIDVIGERGVLSMNAFAQNLHWFDDRGGRYRLIPWAEGGDPGMIRAFFDAVARGTAPPVTGEDGLHALEVALCAYQSARRHEAVTCPDALLG
jgi:predicted dehydrogenase